MSRITRPGLIVLGFALIGGCSDAISPSGQHQLQVEVQVTGPAAVATTSAQLAPASGVTSVEIEQAVLVLGGLKLETAGLDETIDWTLEQSVVIPLDLAGQPTLVFDTDVTAGIYKELEVSIDKLEVGHPDEEELIDDWPLLADASVLVSGNVVRDGSSEAFAFTAPLDIDLELPFPAPRRIDGGDVEVTVVSLNIEIGRWFEASDGGMLDPNDPVSRSDIEAAIQQSIDVLEKS